MRRCNKNNCNAFNHALLGHPCFVVGRGSATLSFKVQAKLLFHAVWNTKPLHCVRAELELNEKTISDAYARWRKVLTVWVEHKQQAIQHGGLTMKKVRRTKWWFATMITSAKANGNIGSDLERILGLKPQMCFDLFGNCSSCDQKNNAAACARASK